MGPEPRTFDFEVAGVATRQHGVIARRQLLAIGLGERVIKRRIARGHLHVLYRGVYAVGHRRLTTRGRYMAAVLACGRDAVLSHRCAADLWNLRVGGTRLEVSVAGARRRRSGSILVYQPRNLPPQDRTEIDGIPITSLARTLVDLAAVVDSRRLGRAFEEAERIGELDLRTVNDVLARSPNRKGTGNVRALLAERRPTTDTREGLERDFADIVREAGLPAPAYNVLVEGFLVDAAWMPQRLIVEIDSWAFHDKTRHNFENERARHTALQLKGWTVVRLTKGQMPDAARIINALL